MSAPGPRTQTNMDTTRSDPQASSPDAHPRSAPDTAAVERFRARMLNPLKMRGYMLTRLPLALVAGLRVRALTAERCEVSVPYGWRTTNPFRSTYFAAQAMAAELSTGALGLMAAETAPVPVASLIVGMTGGFEKKATAETVFTCVDGAALFDAVARTVRTGEPATAEVETVGRMPDGTVVSRFTFTWSFKRREPRGS
jgi:hypothetical protein